MDVLDTTKHSYFCGTRSRPRDLLITSRFAGLCPIGIGLEVRVFRDIWAHFLRLFTPGVDTLVLVAFTALHEASRREIAPPLVKPKVSLREIGVASLHWFAQKSEARSIVGRGKSAFFRGFSGVHEIFG